MASGPVHIDRDNAAQPRTIRQALKAARCGKLTPVRTVKNPERYLHSSRTQR